MKGHVTQKRGKWYFVLDTGIDTNGKRKQKWFKGDTTEAKTKKLMTLKIAELLKGEYIEPSEMIYADYFQEWLASKKRDLKENTHTVYNDYSKMFLPVIGRLQLDKITPLHIEKMVAKLSETKASSTVRKAYNIVYQSLKKAVALDMIRNNPCDRVDAPRVHEKEMNYWSKEEVQQFMFVAKNDSMWIAFYLALKTGMRRGEIIALKWADIVNNTIIVKQAKSSAGVRSIAITNADIKELEKHRKSQLKNKLKAIEYYDNDLVIATKHGKPIGPRNLLRSFELIIERNNLRKIRFHDLRHTHATMMLLAGVHAKVVSERLGHSTIGITLDIYSHVLPNMQSEAANKLEKLLKC